MNYNEVLVREGLMKEDLPSTTEEIVIDMQERAARESRKVNSKITDEQVIAAAYAYIKGEALESAAKLAGISKSGFSGNIKRGRLSSINPELASLCLEKMKLNHHQTAIDNRLQLTELVRVALYSIFDQKGGRSEAYKQVGIGKQKFLHNMSILKEEFPNLYEKTEEVKEKRSSSECLDVDISADELREIINEMTANSASLDKLRQLAASEVIPHIYRCHTDKVLFAAAAYKKGVKYSSIADALKISEERLAEYIEIHFPTLCPALAESYFSTNYADVSVLPRQEEQADLLLCIQSDYETKEILMERNMSLTTGWKLDAAVTSGIRRSMPSEVANSKGAKSRAVKKRIIDRPRFY